jgi:hypothetical protein
MNDPMAQPLSYAGLEAGIFWRGEKNHQERIAGGIS